MSVLARVNFTAQQRLDLSHVLEMESFTAFDFRSLVSAFSGNSRPIILRGFEVVGKTGLSLSIRVNDSVVFNTLDANSSFYVGLPDDADIVVSLPAAQSNVFIEGKFTNQTRSSINQAYWDSIALTGEDAGGTEFTASANSQNVVVLEISSNTVGFNVDSIPICRVVTSSSEVTSMLDARPLMFRLGSGGTTPDFLHKYPWGNSRQESVLTGTDVGDATLSPFRARDSVGSINDKGLRTYKDWMDAVMTRLCETSGSPLWYTSGINQSYITGLTLNSIFFDSEGGHKIQPSDDVSFYWSKNNDHILRSEGVNPVSWQSNYGGLVWSLGGTFTSASSRSYLNVNFASAAPVDGGNVYLLLEREVSKASGNSVRWADNSGYGAVSSTVAISGVSGDFTGIAIGDYIRKASEGMSCYYKIISMYNGSSMSTPNYVADASVSAVAVDSAIASGVSIEPLKYFRSRYASADVYVDTVSGQHPYSDINFYWLGRRVGDNFVLRGFGKMKPGVEVLTIEDTFANEDGGSLGGASDITLEHSNGAIIDGSGNYKLKSGASTQLLKIRRRKRQNLVKSGATSGNEYASIEYAIIAPAAGAFSDGHGLWVKLSDTVSGSVVSLSPGTIFNNTADITNNPLANTNIYQILAPTDNPLRNFDSKDVYLIARKTTINGKPALIFMDGTVIDDYGTYINNYFEVANDARFISDVYLDNKTAKSVLFTDASGKIVEDNTNLFYDSSIPQLGVINFRFGTNTITQNTPTDVGIFTNLGANTLTIGGSTSYIGMSNFRFSINAIAQYTPADISFFTNLGANTLTVGQNTSTVSIPGNLQVLGTISFLNPVHFLASDKLITLGVGDALDGGNGGGIEIADDSKTIYSIATFNGVAYVDLTYSSAHNYTVGQIIVVQATNDVGSISSGQITGEYTIVTYGNISVNPQAQIVDIYTVRIWTTGLANSSATYTSGTPISASIPWSVRVSDASAGYSGITSWAFRVKNATTAPTLTPINGYGIVPTANSTTFSSGRIPFAANDNAGPGSVDTTLDFSDNLKWDGSNLTVGGNIVPPTDNLFALGSVSYRWSNIYAGSSIVNDGFEQFNGITYGSSGSPATPATGKVRIFARNFGSDQEYMYQVNSLGVVSPLGGNGGSGILVQAYDTFLGSLPLVNPTTIDGHIIVDGDLVVFDAFDHKIYKAAVSGGSITWAAQNLFNLGSATPSSGESIRVINGTVFGLQAGVYNDGSVNKFQFNDTVKYIRSGSKAYFSTTALKDVGLTDGISTDIFTPVLAAVGNEHMIIQYSLTRNGKSQTGQLCIAKDSVSVDVVDTFAATGDLGVTFSASIVGSNLVLRALLTSTTFAAVMRYRIISWAD